MSSFRFIHAADIHLDSPLRGLSSDVPEIAARLRLATREALIRLVDSAIERAVDFLLIAGDLYDGDWPDYQTGIFFARQMHRLNEASIPVFVIHGNHDAQSVITRALSLPDNVRVFSHAQAETVTLADHGVALHGMSYPSRVVTDNLVPGYPAPIDGLFNIGLLHTSLAGHAEHETYAPCSLDELVHKGYDYWALGHVHGAAILHEHPHIVFSGNIQGRSVRETGAKSVFDIRITDGRITDMQAVHCDVARWAHLDIDVADTDDANQMMGLVSERIETALADGADGRLLALRLRLHGRTALHDRLVGDDQWLLAEARAAASGLGANQVYVEKVQAATQPQIDSETRRNRQDALGEIQRLLDDAADDPDLRVMIEKDIRRLVQRLKPIIPQPDDAMLQAAIEGDTERLIADAGDYLLARLSEDVSRP